jgi:hypothetical protein
MIIPIRAGVPATERAPFFAAFSELEGEICNLTRAARLTELQLYKAVGQLSFVDGEYTEIPEAEATELAIFAVSQTSAMAKRLEELYLGLFNEAATAA